MLLNIKEATYPYRVL